MNYDQLTEEELSELAGKAQAFYREKIRPPAYPKRKGRMLVMDVGSLDYEIDARLSVAIERVQNRQQAHQPLFDQIDSRGRMLTGGTRSLSEGV